MASTAPAQMLSIFLTGTAAAGTIAMINAVGNLGGYVGPLVVGWIKDSTGSFKANVSIMMLWSSQTRRLSFSRICLGLRKRRYSSFRCNQPPQLKPRLRSEWRTSADTAADAVGGATELCNRVA